MIKTKRPASTAKMIMETTSEAAKALALCPEYLSTLALVLLPFSTLSRFDILVRECMLCKAIQSMPTECHRQKRRSVAVSMCRNDGHWDEYFLPRLFSPFNMSRYRPRICCLLVANNLWRIKFVKRYGETKFPVSFSVSWWWCGSCETNSSHERVGVFAGDRLKCR